MTHKRKIIYIAGKALLMSFDLSLSTLKTAKQMHKLRHNSERDHFIKRKQL